MKIVEQSHQIIHSSTDMLKLIESAGRTCYKSEKKITDSSSNEFAKMIVNSDIKSGESLKIDIDNEKISMTKEIVKIIRRNLLEDSFDDSGLAVFLFIQAYNLFQIL